MTKFVYTFGGKTAEGKADMKNLLGGKGANLAEMCLLGLPVPAGLTITTECCTAYYDNNCQLPAGLMDEVWKGMANVEKLMGMKYDDAENPLLVSCRSGARSSMPGMMDTVLNIGLSSKTIPGMLKRTNNPRFVYDSYRRLIMMYADVVMEKSEGIEPADGKGIRKQLDDMLDEYKAQHNYKSDTDLTADDLQKLAEAFKLKVKEVLGVEFPDDAKAQMEGGIKAVFKSWNGKKAVSYRKIEGIPDDWGTAVNVQAMVFGNMGDNSATGVAFTRNPVSVPPTLSTTTPRTSRTSTCIPCRSSCPRPIKSSATSAASSKTISTTCSTSSSPSRTASCTCCSAAWASVPAWPL